MRRMFRTYHLVLFDIIFLSLCCLFPGVSLVVVVVVNGYCSTLSLSDHKAVVQNVCCVRVFVRSVLRHQREEKLYTFCAFT